MQIYKINVNCKRLSDSIQFLIMKNIVFIVSLLFFISCENSGNNDILPNTNVDITIDLNLPEYIKLQTPPGWLYINGGLKGILLQNTGIGDNPYKAWERSCPENDCSVPMTFDGSLKNTCSCDGNEYSIIDGSPQNGGSKFVREYNVRVISSSLLKITNF